MARTKVVKASGRVRRATKKGTSKHRLPLASRWAGTSSRLFAVISGGVVLLILLGLLERFIWLGAIARELGPLLSALGLVLAITSAWLRRWGWTSALAAACVIALLPAWPLLRPVRLTPEKGPLLRVAEATLDGATVSPERARRLREAAPDLVGVVGATDAALRVLDAALPNLPYRTRKLGPDGQGALWSRLPLRGVSRESVARIRLGKCDVQLALLSVPSRLSLEQQTRRADSIRSLEQQADSARAIWLGHLGSRPQSYDLATLLAKQRLRDTRLGHGTLASTPTWLGALGLATDHVLVRGWIAIRERSVREALGEGAHATVMATLELTSPRCR